jgi:hypothetical protein
MTDEFVLQNAKPADICYIYSVLLRTTWSIASYFPHISPSANDCFFLPGSTLQAITLGRGEKEY